MERTDRIEQNSELGIRGQAPGSDGRVGLGKEKQLYEKKGENCKELETGREVGVKIVVKLILNDASFLNERNEIEGGKNEGSTGIYKI